MSVYIEDTFSPDVPSIFLRPKWPTASVYLTAFVTDNIFKLSSKKWFLGPNCSKSALKGRLKLRFREWLKISSRDVCLPQHMYENSCIWATLAISLPPPQLMIWSALIVDQSIPMSILAKSSLGSWIWSVFRSGALAHWDPEMRDSWTLQCQRYQFSQFHWQYPSMRREKAKAKYERVFSLLIIVI